MHIDTGQNFPEVLEFRDRAVAARRRAPDRRQRAGLDRPGQGRRPRSHGLAQPPPDRDAARRDQRQQLRRRLRRRPTRRGQGPRQGAHPLVPRRLRPVGPAPAAPRALAALPGQGESRRAPARLPPLGLDRTRHLAVHRARGDGPARRSTSPTSATSCCATTCGSPSVPSSSRATGEKVERLHGALPHGRRRQLHRRGRSRSPRRSPRSSTRSRVANVSERGATRADDRFCETAMEDRKREGYF